MWGDEGVGGAAAGAVFDSAEGEGYGADDRLWEADAVLLLRAGAEGGRVLDAKEGGGKCGVYPDVGRSVVHAG